MTRIRRSPLVVALLAAVAALLLLPGPASGQDASVAIQDLSFTPASATVGVGDTVTWTNNDEAIPHTVTSADRGPLASGNLTGGQTYAFTFDQAGSYAYRCDIHPEMNGTVVVQAATADDATADDAADDSAAPPATGTGLAPETGSSGYLGLILVLGAAILAAGSFAGYRRLAQK